MHVNFSYAVMSFPIWKHLLSSPLTEENTRLVNRSINHDTKDKRCLYQRSDLWPALGRQKRITRVTDVLTEARSL